MQTRRRRVCFFNAAPGKTYIYVYITEITFSTHPETDYVLQCVWFGVFICSHVCHRFMGALIRKQAINHFESARLNSVTACMQRQGYVNGLGCFSGVVRGCFLRHPDVSKACTWLANVNRHKRTQTKLFVTYLGSKIRWQYAALVIQS